ncbi:putative 3-oxoacyl-[acyl-carrier-protein] reductase [Xenorhabdus poinarii G6]|uniref:Putative 3-oxoacyl-[acyl-carrier-protein] reductase n=1 Tax=Xenorhabdus poinarii G6 TaxID=1354304 RepID=A0A068R532_9GAMM|nr:SDR family oxidoreductase [Xenorhabdus poinarii]CDG22377.1 putative 3-oxoacyl-[acyl-carrier-protein] reductase [Xenorhabdus poinarii G6]
MIQGLDSKVIIITGAGSGIGLSTATAFLSAGARVIAGDINLSQLLSLPVNDKLVPCEFDVCNLDNINEVVKNVIERYGSIDVLVNNAASVQPRKGFLDVKDEDWHTTIDINLLGYIRMARAVLPYMQSRKRGVLLHIASEAALMPNMNLPDYSILKSAVLSLSKVISREFGKDGIRSNVVSPAFVRTAVYDKSGGLGDELERKYKIGREEAIQRYTEDVGVAVGRLGKPDEVASLLLFLASDAAAFITGANYLVDGGVTPFI